MVFSWTIPLLLRSESVIGYVTQGQQILDYMYGRGALVTATIERLQILPSAPENHCSYINDRSALKPVYWVPPLLHQRSAPLSILLLHQLTSTTAWMRSIVDSFTMRSLPRRIARGDGLRRSTSCMCVEVHALSWTLLHNNRELKAVLGRRRRRPLTLCGW